MSDNPFLLPPGRAKLPEKPTSADAARDPAEYIAVPASVESATHRIARPEQRPEPVEADSAPREHEPLESEPLDDETRLAVPRRWSLTFPDGSRVHLDGPALIGRNPAAIPDRPDATLLAVDDGGKTVSKTHALVEPAPGGVRVRELHSTNGITIDTTESREVLRAGAEAVAPLGSTILLGSFEIGVAAG